MAFTMKTSGVPAGHYRAKFTGWEPGIHPEYGDRICWSFEVVDGEHKGAVTTRFTSAKLSKKSAMAGIAAGLRGKKLEPGDEFDPDEYVGREYLLIVGETESGATRVESIIAA